MSTLPGEKTNASWSPHSGRTTHSAVRRCVIIGLCAIFVVTRLAISVFPASCIDRESKQAAKSLKGGAFNWDKIPTRPELDYHDCYDNFQCARLQLPLDYWNGTTDKNISLAVIKLPARVPVTDPRYAGPILTNPGGPGGSGVGFAMRAALPLTTALDGHSALGENDKFYDIVSFDPRGVGLTEPAVACSGGAAAAQSWLVRTMEEGTLTSSDAAVGRLWSMAQALGGKCSDVEDDDIQHYLSTVSVARDMIEIIEAHGRWREREAIRLIQKKRHNLAAKHYQMPSDMGLDSELLAKLSHKPGAEKIQYWGFSYGSYLGETFAAMFPDRIHRFIIDGIVDADDYAAALWFDNLVDTEKDMNAFYYNCARVGYPTCPLAKVNGTAEDVSQRVQNIITHTYHNPLPVTEPTSEIVSWSDIRMLIFSSLYSPNTAFPFLANVLAGIERGNADLLADLLRQYHSFSCPGRNSMQTTPTPIRNKTAFDLPSDPFAGAAIACTDGDPSPITNKTVLESHMSALQALSPTLGDIWASISMQCSGYTLRPYHRFTGPWEGNTSHPILLLSNTADPVTPLASARKMVKGYAGARILVQDAPGHCSISGFSKCNLEHVRRYMHAGVLPPEDTVCGVDVLPWGPTPGSEEVVSREVDVMSGVFEELHAALLGNGGALMGYGMTGKVKMEGMLNAIARTAVERPVDGTWWYGQEGGF